MFRKRAVVFFLKMEMKKENTYDTTGTFTNYISLKVSTVNHLITLVKIPEMIIVQILIKICQGMSKCSSMYKFVNSESTCARSRRAMASS